MAGTLPSHSESATISGMRIRTSSQRGFASMGVLFGAASALFVLALVFGIWAFANYSDYKTNFDAKLAQDVATARQEEDQVKDAAFAEAAKSPVLTYHGPSTYGSVAISYPRTWSGYVADTRTSSPFVDGYFYPGVVPDTQDLSSVYALRVQVVDSSYSSVLNQFSSFVKQGVTKVSPYKAAKVPSIIGVRVDGKLTATKSGTMIIMPLRNMTLKLWTEGPQFEGDFGQYVLPSFTFAP